MNRFAIEEITFKRIVDAGVRRIADIPDRFLWSGIFPEAHINKERILAYKNAHKGERCIIMGNGPSLGKMDLSGLRNEITFGTNRIYLLFNQVQFATTYYTAVNDLVLEQFDKEIDSFKTTKFINWAYRRSFSEDKNIFLKMKFSIRDNFSKDLTKPLCTGGTVTFVALQIAYWMGFSEVILIGVDHNFAAKGTPNLIEKREQKQDIDHFHPNYFPKGSKWQLPDLRRSEVAYQLALEAFKADGRTIIDATINGKCPVFPKADFYSIF